MSTTRDTITYLEDQLRSLGTRVRTRAMFGEYALYCDNRVVALICDDQVFVKITPASTRILGPGYPQGAPYPGAKPHYLLDSDDLDSQSHLCDLIVAIASSLPLPR